MTSVTIGPQPVAPAPYPTPPPKPQITSATAQAILGFLNDPGAILPPSDFTSIASSLQSVTRVCGQLTSIVNAASTSVVLVNAIRNNASGFALMVGLGVVTSAAQAAGVNPNAIVSSAVQRVNDIVSTPMKFLEAAFRARSYAQASFTGNGFADVFAALGSVTELLTACKTFVDLLSGGVTANFGPGADNTEQGRRLTAAGISINGAQIRAGLRAVTQAMRDIGTLWSPNDPQWIGTPAGLVISLRDQGIGEDIGLREAMLKVSVMIDDDDDVYYSSPFTVLQGLKNITGANLDAIIERTGCSLAKPWNVLTAADLCQADNVISQQALDNLPYGNMTQGLGQTIATLAMRERVTWEVFADTLDQLDLPDVGLINNPNFASDMAALKPYLGYGNGLFNDATIHDLIGTAGGAAHTEAYQLISEANDRLEATPEGKALKVALAYYDTHSDPGDPLNALAETNLIAALEAIKNSTNPEVQQASADAEKGILDSALQLVGEITNAVQTGYAIYTTVVGILAFATSIGNSIAATAASLGSDGGTSSGAATNAGLLGATKFPEGFWTFTNGLKAVLAIVGMIIDAVADATGITDLLAVMANPNSRGGQALLALIAETKNKNLLKTIGVGIPEVDVDAEAARRRARFGFGLTEEQQNLITAYGVNRNMNADQIQEMLFINAYYGYQRHFFENSAGYYEGFRVKRPNNVTRPKNALATATTQNAPGTGPTATAENPPASVAEALAQSNT